MFWRLYTFYLLYAGLYYENVFKKSVKYVDQCLLQVKC